MTTRASRRQLPEVRQAGVVPQSLREGLGTFIPNAVAPHPRAEVRELAHAQPRFTSCWCPSWTVHSTERGFNAPPWRCALEMNSSTSPPGMPWVSNAKGSVGIDQQEPWDRQPISRLPKVLRDTDRACSAHACLRLHSPDLSDGPAVLHSQGETLPSFARDFVFPQSAEGMVHMSASGCRGLSHPHPQHPRVPRGRNGLFHLGPTMAIPWALAQGRT